MFLSVFVGIFVIKDFPSVYYRDNLFILNKFFIMLFRGTIDNVDSDKNLDIYKFDQDMLSEKKYFNLKCIFCL